MKDGCDEDECEFWDEGEGQLSEDEEYEDYSVFDDEYDEDWDEELWEDEDQSEIDSCKLILLFF
jgi:hypothetical protein